MKYSRWKWVIRLVSVPGAILMGYGLINNGKSTAAAVCFVVGMMILIADFIMAGINLRCPHCNALVPDTITERFKKCPKCGKTLDVPPSRE